MTRGKSLSQATIVYAITIVMLIGGLWIILAVGSTLRPPEDLSGKWTLTSPTATTAVTLEQSGRYFHLSAPGWETDLTLAETHDEAGREKITLVSRSASMTFQGIERGDHFTVTLTGPMAGTYQADRTAHTYPSSATRPTTAAS